MRNCLVRYLCVERGNYPYCDACKEGNRFTMDERLFKPNDQVMSIKEFTEQMKELAQNSDQETRHVEMDGLMIRQLKALGYDEAMDVYIETPMWYA